MSYSRIILSFCGVLVHANFVAPVNVATATATYAWYNNYALSPLLPIAVRSVAWATKDFCAYLCTATPNCFAATLVSANNTCLLLANCGHVVLVKSNNSVTSVISSMPSINRNFPVTYLPLVLTCNGYLSQLGSGNLTSASINLPSAVANYSTGMPSSPTILTFNCTVGLLPSSGYLPFFDNVSNSFDLFSSGNSFSVAFMVQPTCTNYQQAILGLAADSSTKNYCFAAIIDSCSGNPCVKVGYVPTCGEWGTAVAQAIFSYPVNLNSYYHVAAVYDSVSTTFTGYVNGVAIATQSGGLTNSAVIPVFLGIGNARVGVYGLGGSLYCVQLFKSALGAADVTSLNQLCRSGGVILQ